MTTLLENVKRIGHVSAALCVLKGLRAKIELNRKQPHRLWKHFPSLKGVILTGRAGTGKTHVMQQIFDGLNLKTKTDHNSYTGIWVDGGATTVGRREKFKENPNSVIFWNEIGCNDLPDVRLMKQITEGKISYMKHGDLEETKFSGLLIGCTNDFSAKGKVGRDLEALRDRMDIVEVGPPYGYDPILAIEDEKHYFKINTEKPDWHAIADALRQDTDETLSVSDRDKIRPFWVYKVRECLDGRVLTRAGSDFIDCFVFCKRFFGTLDDEDVFDAALNLAYDSVTINPISISDLSIIQRDIVDSIIIDPNKLVTTAQVRKHLRENGRFINNTTLHRNLNKLIEKGCIVKARHGEYSLLRPDGEFSEDEVNEFDELLKLL